MLAASITHWLGTFHFWIPLLVKLEFYPINVNCLLQALHIDWALFKVPMPWSYLNLSLENYPINVKCLFYPINVKCLRYIYAQAFHIDWVVSNFFSKSAKKKPKIWELPNQCEMLALYMCASISHWLGSFEHWLGSFQICRKIFEIFVHWLGSFEKLPNQCEMLAHTKNYATYELED